MVLALAGLIAALGIFFVVLIVILILGYIFWIWMFVHALKNRDILWIVLFIICFFTGFLPWIISLLYYLIVYKGKK